MTEILQIDNSKPAYNFKPVVFPNAWQKSKKEKTTNSLSPKGEKYRNYFQILIGEPREKHKFTAARAGQPQNWYSFSSGIRGILYAAVLGTGERARAEIYIDDGDVERNKYIFDKLKEQSLAFDGKFSEDLVWERLDKKRASRIAVYRDGAIESSDSDLEEIRKWHIGNLLKFKEVFPSEIEAILNDMDRIND